ncbi:hypothetical protein FKM82_025664 [Ascaphus truei]
MLLMFGVGLMGNCKQLELHLKPTGSLGWAPPTHPRHCVPPVPIFCSCPCSSSFSWLALEERLGTLCYLHLSCLCTLCCATLYLLLSWLLPSTPCPPLAASLPQLAAADGSGTALPHPSGGGWQPFALRDLVTAQSCVVSPLCFTFVDH